MSHPPLWRCGPCQYYEGEAIGVRIRCAAQDAFYWFINRVPFVQGLWFGLAR